MSEPVRRKRRILVVAEAVTLAHVARPIALAKTLNATDYDITLACDPRYNELLGDSGVDLQRIHSIPTQQFLAYLSRGRPLYTTATLAAYVREDLHLIANCDPDAVVGDFRLSLSVSARVARKPYINISNAYWSPYARPRFIVPELPFVRFVGVKVAQGLFELGRHASFAYHAMPLNRLRRHYGLPLLKRDVRSVYTDADYMLYADIPQLVPTYNRPDTHFYVGPTLWSPEGDLPRWWNSLPDNMPIVYVTFGSSGSARLLPLALEALAPLPVRVIAASAGRKAIFEIPSNAYLADYVPGEQAAQRAALVISNGGNQSCYQAFACGKPVLGIPTNLDQYLNMSYVEAFGAGAMMRAGTVTRQEIGAAVNRIMADIQYAEAAQRLMQIISSYPSRTAFGRVVERACTVHKVSS